MLSGDENILAPFLHSREMACLITKERLEEQEKKYEDVSKDFLAGVRERHNTQRKLERKLLSLQRGVVTCPTVMDAVRKLPGIDFGQLEQKITDGFYHPKFGQEMMCLANALYLDEKVLGLRPEERLRDNLEVTSLGRGASGSVLTATLRRAADVFALKVPSFLKNRDEMTHEAVVGLFGTNQLRAYCPNFSLIYGFFRCSPPLMDKKEVRTWCDRGGDGSVGYVIYELITPSQTLDDYISSGASTLEIMESYLQVMFALKVGKRIRFTHYDLHSNNVVLRPPSGGAFYIPYVGVDSPPGSRGRTRYVRASSGRVAMIIDYGASYFEMESDGKKVALGSIGNEDIYQYSFFDDRSFLIHDAYKLLCTMLMGGKENNQSFYDEAKSLLKFWNPCQEADAILEEQDPFYYAVPEVAAGYYDFDEWVEYCIEWLRERKYGDVVVDAPPPDSRVLRCLSGCPEFEIFPAKIPIPQRLSEFADYHRVLTADERKEYSPHYRGLLTNILEGKSTYHLGLPKNIFSVITHAKVYYDTISNAGKIIQRLMKVRKTSSVIRWVTSLKEVFPESNDIAGLVVKRAYYDVTAYMDELVHLKVDIARVLELTDTHPYRLRAQLPLSEEHRERLDLSTIKERADALKQRYLDIRYLVDVINEDLSYFKS